VEERVAELIKILYRRDDKWVPVFLSALEETCQEDVARLLRHEGLLAFVVYYKILYDLY